jgi:HK97 family phage portal protein
MWRGVAARASKYAGIPLRDPALVAMLGNQPVTAGVDVDEQSALGSSAVWQAVTLIASNVAAMPCVLFETRTTGRVEATGDPAHELMLLAPNDEQTPFIFVETLQGHALTWGNGYAEIERAGDGPDAPVTGLCILPPDQVSPERDQQSGELVYRFTAKHPGEESALLLPENVLHIPGIGYDGLKGYGVVQMARESIGLGLAMEKYAAALFGRGCAPGGLLEVPEELEMSEKARKNLRESFELLHRGPDNAHRIAILENGIKFNTLSIPPEDAQFLQSRTFHISDIARWFNIPPHLLRDLSHATFSNIEHQGIDFLVYTLRPWLLKWQQELRRKLIPRKKWGRYSFEHDVHNLLLTDITARYNAYNVGRNAGFLTLNDILRREKLPLLPSDLGDSRLVPANMRAVDQTGQDVLTTATPGDPTAPGQPAQVQDTAMNGAQVASLLQVVQAVAAGQLDADAGSHMIEIAFPDVPQAKINSMLAPYRKVKPLAP